MSIQPEKTKLEGEFKHARPLTNCVWDPLSRAVYFGAEDNGVHRFDIQSQALTHLAAHDSWVRALQVSRDGKWLASGGYDGRLALWPIETNDPKPHALIEAHHGWIRALAFSPNGELIATCGNDRLIKLWNAKDLTPVGEYSGHASHVYNVCFTQDGSRLVSCDLQGIVKLWPAPAPLTDQANGPAPTVGAISDLKAEALAKYDTTFRADIGGARAMSFSADGSTLALGGITNVTNAFAGIGEVVVLLVDWQQNKIRLQLECKDKQRGTIWGVAWHPDGYWVGACGGSGGFLVFWKEAAQEVFKMKLKSDARGMSLSPDGTQIAIAHSDSQLRLYRLEV